MKKGFIYKITPILTLFVLIIGVIVFQKDLTVSAYSAGAQCFLERGSGEEDGSFCSMLLSGDGGSGSSGSTSHPVEGGACTSGNTYCYTDTNGGHQTTCQTGGVWGPYVHCSDFRQRCSCEGYGCRCKYL